MSTHPSARRTSSSTWIGLVLGVVLLALVIGFAVLLPKASDESTGALKLPDTLPGGYTAADLEQAFTGQYASKAKTLAAQQRTTKEYGDKVLSDVLQEDAVTRTYASKDLSTGVFVQAFRAAGGAFAPESIPDPAVTQQERTAQELVRQGDAVCIVQWTPVANGSPVDPSAVPTFASCQHSEGDLTVQASAPSMAVADLVKLTDAAFAAVS